MIFRAYQIRINGSYTVHQVCFLAGVYARCGPRGNWKWSVGQWGIHRTDSKQWSKSHTVGRLFDIKYTKQIGIHWVYPWPTMLVGCVPCQSDFPLLEVGMGCWWFEPLATIQLNHDPVLDTAHLRGFAKHITWGAQSIYVHRIYF